MNVPVLKNQSLIKKTKQKQKKRKNKEKKNENFFIKKTAWRVTSSGCKLLCQSSKYLLPAGSYSNELCCNLGHLQPSEGPKNSKEKEAQMLYAGHVVIRRFDLKSARGR